MKEVGDSPHLLTMGDGRLFRPQLSFYRNRKMGGVSIISGTLMSASGAFPTFAIFTYFIKIFQ